jgi:hypothetical protein
LRIRSTRDAVEILKYLATAHVLAFRSRRGGGFFYGAASMRYGAQTADFCDLHITDGLDFYQIPQLVTAMHNLALFVQ